MDHFLQLKDGSTNVAEEMERVNSELKDEHTDDTSESKKPRRLRNSSQPLYDENLTFDDDSNSKDHCSREDPEFQPSKRNHKMPLQALSGYALFCKESREKLKMENSTLLGDKTEAKLAEAWQELTPSMKRSFSTRARHLDRPPSKKAKRRAISTEIVANTKTEPEYLVFCCAWDKCDYQFEVVDECAQHITDEHLLPNQTGTEALRPGTMCRWRGCLRYKRCSMPFVLYDRLVRHVLEEHVLIAKTLKPFELSVNFIGRGEET